MDAGVDVVEKTEVEDQKKCDSKPQTPFTLEVERRRRLMETNQLDGEKKLEFIPRNPAWKDLDDFMRDFELPNTFAVPARLRPGTEKEKR